MRELVQSVLDDIVRPLIEADGGTIELVNVTDDCVSVRLGGAYAGCPSGPFTLRGIIEPAIRKATGESTRVELVPAVPGTAASTPG
jgi:Fe-S cluster biogenesis protein NfuA